MTIKSVVSIANRYAVLEMALMIESFYQHNNLPMILGCDEASGKILLQKFPNYPITVKIILDRDDGEVISHGDDGSTEFSDAFMRLLRCKSQMLQIGIELFGTSIYVDCDMLFLGPIDSFPTKNHDILLSPHFIRPEIEANQGRYNAGYLVCSNPSFTTWWEKNGDPKNGYDQKCLDSAHEYFNVGYVPLNHNFGWWRFYLFQQGLDVKVDLVATQRGIEVNGLPLISVHNHFIYQCWTKSMDASIKEFANVIVRLMKETELPAFTKILGYLEELKTEVNTF